MASNTGDMSDKVKYIYELPYMEWKELCNILDVNNQWEKLGGLFMGFKVHELSEIRRVELCGQSPTARLLQIWGQQNNTVLKLFYLLLKIKHYQAMRVLMPFIPAKYHHLIMEGEYSLTKMLKSSDLAFHDIDSPLPLYPARPPQHLSRPVAVNPAAKELDYNGAVACAIASNEDNSMNKKLFVDLDHNIDHSDGKKVPSKTLHSVLGLDCKDVKKQNSVDERLFCKNAEFNKVVNTTDFNVEMEEPYKQVHAKVDFDREYLEKANAKLQALGAVNENDSVDENITPPQTERTRKISNTSDVSTLNDCSVPLIPYKELEEATSFWSENLRLGKGGFGVVFKGLWKNTEVAIKRLDNEADSILNNAPSPSSVSHSLEELRFLQSYRHDNILQVYGFSADSFHPFCLVYQFMPNGSLEDRLHHKLIEAFSCGRGQPLNWWQRLTIAIGTARALQFLHTAKETPLVHGDVKSGNILLDKNFEPKLGDFGLAREGPNSKFTSMTTELVKNSKNQEGLRDLKAGSCYANVFDFLLKIGQECTSYAAKNRPNMERVYQDLNKFKETLIDVSRSINSGAASPLTMKTARDSTCSPIPPSLSYNRTSISPQGLFLTPNQSMGYYSNTRPQNSAYIQIQRPVCGYQFPSTNSPIPHINLTPSFDIYTGKDAKNENVFEVQRKMAHLVLNQPAIIRNSSGARSPDSHIKDFNKRQSVETLKSSTQDKKEVNQNLPLLLQEFNQMYNVQGHGLPTIHSENNSEKSNIEKSEEDCEETTTSISHLDYEVPSDLSTMQAEMTSQGKQSLFD